ncbi:hypothetical protein Purlil1_7707 [Purpureocillium lilacinum]|uniref:Uncharacterized protein n=1 Tax=Purpureocillium lilacinum TaxID=33203 RepID=A0ABR0BV77_PURLI|nr:hypothetical protein Purlil1_7707 [Purpureocillium lilacinum]
MMDRISLWLPWEPVKLWWWVVGGGPPSRGVLWRAAPVPGCAWSRRCDRQGTWRPRARISTVECPLSAPTSRVGDRDGWTGAGRRVHWPSRIRKAAKAETAKPSMHTARRTATCIYLSEPRHRITVNLAWAVLGSLPSSQAIGPRGPKPPGTKALEGATNLPDLLFALVHGLGAARRRWFVNLAWTTRAPLGRFGRRALTGCRAMSHNKQRQGLRLKPSLRGDGRGGTAS